MGEVTATGASSDNCTQEADSEQEVGWTQSLTACLQRPPSSKEALPPIGPTAFPNMQPAGNQVLKSANLEVMFHIQFLTVPPSMSPQPHLYGSYSPA